MLLLLQLDVMVLNSFWYMSKDDAKSIMNNSDLNEKREFYNFFSLNKKCVKQLIIKETEK